MKEDSTRHSIWPNYTPVSRTIFQAEKEDEGHFNSVFCHQMLSQTHGYLSVHAFVCKYVREEGRKSDQHHLYSIKKGWKSFYRFILNYHGFNKCLNTQLWGLYQYPFSCPQHEDQPSGIYLQVMSDWNWSKQQYFWSWWLVFLMSLPLVINRSMPCYIINAPGRLQA